jgi:abequosyltransferase
MADNLVNSANPLLDIVIPTYERLDPLKINLFRILQDLQGFSIAIYISDDSRNDDISDFVTEFKEHHKYIYYKKNDPRLGHDKNFVSALNQGKALYTWIIGDRVGLAAGAIENVLGVISKNMYDIVSINEVGRDINFSSGYYDTALSVLDNFGWHLTHTGVTIYSRRTINAMSSFNIEECRNFPQISIIFNYLAKDCSFFWINDELIYGLPSTESYWSSKVFSVFVDDWQNVIYSLPKIYTLASKERIILAHSKNSKLFSTKSLLKMRMDGNYDSVILQNYRQKLLKHSEKGFFVLYVISIFPRWLLKLYKTVKSHTISYSKDTK